METAETASPESTESTTPQIDITGGATPAQETPAAEVQPKADATQTDASDNASDAKAAASVYEPFTLPDGVSVRPEDMAVFEEIGTEFNLDQAGAQRLVDLSLTVQNLAIEATQERIQSERSAEQQSWRDALNGDKELGGANLAATQKLVTAFESTGLASEGLINLLTQTGVVHHPEMVRMMAAIGKMVSEDPVNFDGGEVPTDGQSAAQRMFANSGHQ